MHFLRTSFLLALLTVLFVSFGYFIDGMAGMAIAFVVAMAMNFLSYWYADKIVLSLYKAQEVDEKTAPHYYGIVKKLALRAGLPMPKVCIIESDQPNAFATGRNPECAAVAATTGLLQALSADELSGVMAHELAHIHNRDTLTMTLTATLAGAISMLAHTAKHLWMFSHNREHHKGKIVMGAVLGFIAPFIALLVQMAISRTREYAADHLGATLCQNPLHLAKALEKLDQYRHERVNPIAEENPATAHLFIVNPLKGGFLDSLFSTHPRMENRIARLHDMARPERSSMNPWS